MGPPTRPARRTVGASKVTLVLAPIAIEQEAEGALRPQLLNLNADTAAGEAAAALGAERLVFLTDVPGVLDAAGKVQARIGPKQAQELLAAGAIAGGMIPKVEAGLRAAMAGVQTIVVDGREAGALRAVLAGKQMGTRIG